jgi:uncharacterized protein (TIGR02246 family)
MIALRKAYGAASETKSMIRNVKPALACATAALFLSVQPAPASTRADQAAIMRLEARWLIALRHGDRATIASILAPDYKHVTSSGKLLDREQEISAASEPAPPMKWTDQTIDFAGETAIVHGLNTMTESGKAVRERFTDVFVNERGVWLAIAAQETPVTVGV